MRSKLILFVLGLFSIFFVACAPVSSGGGSSSGAPYHDDIPVAEKAKSDWLFLMYMDGDNDLQDSIFNNLAEAQSSLLALKQGGEDVSVKVVTLFDGINNQSLRNIEGTYIWELNSTEPFVPDTVEEFLDGVTNLTYTAGFLSTTYNSRKKSSEVDMADPKTLTSFINWASKRYTADKVVLLISDHGSGPWSRYERSDASYGKAVCQDDTSNTGPMGTNELSIALGNAGIAGLGTEQNPRSKFDIVIFDSCLSCAVEEIYEIRKYTDYVIASPQSVPGRGFPFFYETQDDDVPNCKVTENEIEKNYISMIGGLKSDWSVEDFGKEVVRCYANEYSEIFKNLTEHSYDAIDFRRSTTCSFVKTEGLEALADSLDAFAKYIVEGYKENDRYSN